jgi:hypothetical protein
MQGTAKIRAHGTYVLRRCVGRLLMTEQEWTSIRRRWAADAQLRLERIDRATKGVEMAAFEKAAIKLLERDELSSDARAYLVRKLDRQTDENIKRRLGWSRRRLLTAKEQLEGLLKTDESATIRRDLSVEVLGEFAEVQRYK